MKDRVTPALHAAVLVRDRRCVLNKLDETHVCRDAWGQVHMPTALHLLTLEHVKTELRMGVRAPSDMAHLLALCAGANLKPPSKDERAAFRAYLLEVNEIPA